MKSTGIVRRVDELGRIVIPKETREQLGICEKDSLEIFIDGEESTIIFKKYTPGCIFCGQLSQVVNFGEKLVCNDCIKDLKQELK
jgi:transcriptional pleiotropic regulator of transition state genes